MLIDYLSLAIGAGAILLLIVIAQIIKRFKSKNYILPELKNHVMEAHKNLQEANIHLNKLYKAFIEIEKENA
jgi:hypothetical protein